MYGHKWASQEGPRRDEKNSYTANFLLWCRKLEHLSDEDFKRGFDQIEYLVRDAARQGDEIWPPSYAGFIGYCERPFGAKAHKPFKQLALQDKTAVEAARAEGKKQLDHLKSLFV